MDKHLHQVAMGKVPADLVIKNGQIVNVFTSEIYPGGVAVAGDKIAAVGDVDYAIGENTTVIDAGGKYITPGFIDGHIHPESANLSMPRFAEVVLAHGTTSIFTDLHEIGVVGGMEAMVASLDEGKQTPLKFYWVIPSHIPFSPMLETSGGTINADIIEKALEREDVVGLSEAVSFYVAFEHPDLMRSMEATQKARKVICGHAPDAVGPLWNTFVSAGATNDHEALSAADVLLRARSGVNAMLRHNLIVPTLPELIKAILENKDIDTRMMSLCTDDTTAIMLAKEGHMDYLVKTALGLGLDFVTAIQMVTLNVAAAFHKDFEIGGLAPGRLADINIISGPEDFKVLKTIANGKLVAENHKLTAPIAMPAHKPLLLNTFHVKKAVSADDLVIQVKQNATTAHMHIMRTLPWVPITEGGEADLPVRNGYVNADTAQDLLHISVIERHHATGNIGNAFIGGMGLKRGAMGSSIGHDHHNVVVMGANPADMAVAANRIVEIGGGVVLVEDGKIIDEISFPIVGLLTDLDAWTLAEKRQSLLAKATERGCGVSDAYMFLSFITLAAIPAFAITDKGYVDVEKQQLMDPVLSVA